jgi:menaquinone-dependent protoporphyrinogen oxidase
MTNVLIVYGTTEGHTAKIAETIAQEIAEKGHHVRAVSSAAAPTGKELATFDAFIVGSPVHIGKFDKSLRAWTRQNHELLQRRHSAFFSVCLGILENNSETKREEAKIVENFLHEVSWTPKLTTIFAGALKYSKYGWLKKLLMKRIARKAGGDTDTSRDYDYTNWNEVRSFAQRFEALLADPGTISALSIGKR